MYQLFLLHSKLMLHHGYMRFLHRLVHDMCKDLSALIFANRNAHLEVSHPLNISYFLMYYTLWSDTVRGAICVSFMLAWSLLVHNNTNADVTKSL